MLVWFIIVFGSCADLNNHMCRVRGLEIWKLKSPVSFAMTGCIDCLHTLLIPEGNIIIKRQLKKTGVREAQKIIVARRQILIEAVSGERKSRILRCCSRILVGQGLR